MRHSRVTTIAGIPNKDAKEAVFATIRDKNLDPEEIRASLQQLMTTRLLELQGYQKNGENPPSYLQRFTELLKTMTTYEYSEQFYQSSFFYETTHVEQALKYGYESSIPIYI